MPEHPPELLPDQPELKLFQSPGALRKDGLKSIDHLVVVMPEKARAAAWKSLPDGMKLRRIAGRARPDAIVRGRLNNPALTGVTLGRLKQPKRGMPSTFAQLALAGRLLADALQDNPKRLGLLVAGFDDPLADSIARAIALAAGAQSFELPAFRSKRRSPARLASLRVFGLDKRIDFSRTLAEIESANLARWLTHLPPNKLDARNFRDIVKSLAKRHGWSMRFLGESELKRRGAGAFLAVAQGNAARDAGIIHLRFRPTGKRRPILALVGKGIIFDTGGTNLKPFKAMLDMHGDMNGSAIALATLVALTRLDFDYPVDCWLAVTENRLSPEAYKSRDVVTASNGQTIEVIHTDAEGRMVLADTLALAGREKPGMIIDYATLTGTCVAALSNRYSGVFTNRPALNDVMIDAGRESGERVWPFPMDEDFDEDLESKAADVLQCSPDASADHILAARFLGRFVPADSAWVHVDLSASDRKSGLAQVPGGPTGFGVRFTLNLLTEQGSRLETLIGDNARDD